MRKIYVLLVLVVMGGFLLSGCGSSEKADAPDQQQTEDNRSPQQTLAVTRVTFDPDPEVDGDLLVVMPGKLEISVEAEGAVQVDFFRSPEASGQGEELIHSDKNPSDGFTAVWEIPDDVISERFWVVAKNQEGQKATSQVYQITTPAIDPGPGNNLPEMNEQEEEGVIQAVTEYLGKRGMKVGGNLGEMVVAPESIFGNRAVVILGPAASEFDSELGLVKGDTGWQVTYQQPLYEFTAEDESAYEAVEALAEMEKFDLGRQPGLYHAGCIKYEKNKVTLLVAPYGEKWQTEYVMVKEQGKWKILSKKALG